MKRGIALRGLVSLVVVVVIFGVVLPKIVDFADVWRVLTELTWLEAVTLGLAAAWNLVTYWILAALSLPGLTIAQAMVATEASTALANSVPGGPAFGMGLTYSMYSSWGFSRPAVALAVTVSGFADLFAKLAMPAAALVFLFLYGDDSPGIVLAALVGAAFLTGLNFIAVMTLKSEPGALAGGAAVRPGRGPDLAPPSPRARRPGGLVRRVSHGGPFAHQHAGLVDPRRGADEPHLVVPGFAARLAPRRGAGKRGGVGRGARRVRFH